MPFICEGRKFYSVKIRFFKREREREILLMYNQIPLYNSLYIKTGYLSYVNVQNSRPIRWEMSPDGTTRAAERYASAHWVEKNRLQNH